ncbi:hypothetical protein [Rathayibacter rathayi]|uniref:hypothetical protein n=1 Tax=Rathayibacter rathayi TaxID=33887 RepID=UPI001329749E|nr:hypothetical protein [Rathayibacter rathayi]MWV74770.1 hypothetical protein [Rathayibacter rathayi NCPPB 2980 = VKM Ac-1601]
MSDGSTLPLVIYRVAGSTLSSYVFLTWLGSQPGLLAKAPGRISFSGMKLDASEFA